MQLRRVSSGLHVKRLAASIPAFIGWVLCFAFLSWFWFAPSASTASYMPRAEKPPPYASKSPPVNNSIIVPIYHEAANLRTLVTRISSVLEQAKIKDRTEIVLVDDNSRDGTEEVVGALKLDGFHVILETRKGKNDVKGLSRAVLRGFEVARGSKMVVMDADLQHPPEVLPKLFSALDKHRFVIGTRYGETGGVSSAWPFYRRVISWGARQLARPLVSVSDPMTGFFGLQKGVFLRSHPLNPSGFKIFLELLLKAPTHPAGAATPVVPEVPYAFGARTVGSSKLSSTVMLRYVAQVIGLYAWRWGWLFHLAFGFLGALAGVVALELVSLVRTYRAGGGVGVRGGAILPIFGGSETKRHKF